MTEHHSDPGPQSAAGRDHDIVLFGASGFVGALTAAHLARFAPEGTRIALAGRSESKLRQVQAEVAARVGEHVRSWPVLTVDSTDAAGLARLAASTRVLATTVGPYARYGKKVVLACAEAGTHYADLTGEVLFVRWSMDEAAEIARTSGARIVHSCGFDSIPSDLGVALTAEQARADDAGGLTETTLRVKSLKGGLSGGTIDSMRQQAIEMGEQPQQRKVAGDPYGLSPDRAAEPKGIKRSRPGGIVAGVLAKVGVERNPDTGRWDGPFVMSSYNTRIVRLSNTLSDWSYGRRFSYREVTDFGSSPVSPVMAAGMGIGLGGVVAGFSLSPTRSLMDRFLPKPGEGPDEEKRANGRFRLEITADTESGARYVTKVGAEYDPGYDGTAVMLGESALALALDDAVLPQRAGVLTPWTGIGSVLAERLVAHGFTFDVHRVR